MQISIHEHDTMYTALHILMVDLYTVLEFESRNRRIQISTKIKSNSNNFVFFQIFSWMDSYTKETF